MNQENNNIILYILIIFNFFSLIIGYILGKVNSISGVSISRENKPTSFFDKNKKEKKSISIDSTTVVTDIKTDNLEKKYSSLGDTKVSNENISSSISKLKSMKG